MSLLVLCSSDAVITACRHVARMSFGGGGGGGRGVLGGAKPHFWQGKRPFSPLFTLFSFVFRGARSIIGGRLPPPPCPP